MMLFKKFTCNTLKILVFSKVLFLGISSSLYSTEPLSSLFLNEIHPSNTFDSSYNIENDSYTLTFKTKTSKHVYELTFNEIFGAHCRILDLELLAGERRLPVIPGKRSHIAIFESLFVCYIKPNSQWKVKRAQAVIPYLSTLHRNGYFSHPIYHSLLKKKPSSKTMRITPVRVSEV
jgi:hypothetical protein